MSAIEFFESIPRMQDRVSRLQDQVDMAYAAAGGSGQRVGSLGSCGGRDAMSGVDAVIDSIGPELDRAKAELERALDYASDVLYGRSGRGGLAKASCSVDADVLMWRYLVGESWTAIGCRLNGETKYPKSWASKRAARALGKVESLGMEVLADS